MGCKWCLMLVRVPAVMVDKWYGSGILRLIRNMEVNLVLTLDAMACVVEVDWEALLDQEEF